MDLLFGDIMKRNESQKVNITEALHPKMAKSPKRLKAYYGWAKLNKVQKRESLVVAFESQPLPSKDRSMPQGQRSRLFAPLAYNSDKGWCEAIVPTLGKNVTTEI